MVQHGAREDTEAAILQRLDDILSAVEAKDFARLQSYHFDSPKFTKFNDSPPLERQDFATACRTEAEDIEALDRLRGRFEEVKIDPFGPVAIVTGLFAYEGESAGDVLTGRIRMTAVLVDDGGEWKITHEHLSPLEGRWPSPAES